MKKLLLHLNFSMALAMLVLIYVDNRNPMMGFLSCSLGYVYLYFFAILTGINCVLSLSEIKPAEKNSLCFPEDKGNCQTAKGLPSAGQAAARTAPASQRGVQSEAVPPQKYDSDLDDLMSEIDNLLKA